MNLTQEQQDKVRSWAATGANLSEIQSRLAEEFSIHISYMDTRFLVIDLKAPIKDKKAPAEKKPAVEPVEPAKSTEDEADALESEPLPAEGNVSVEISPIARPGFALAGSVVFSDGMKAEWGFTNDGRFSLDPQTAGYRPTSEELRKFQTKLRELCSAQGY